MNTYDLPSLCYQYSHTATPHMVLHVSKRMNVLLLNVGLICHSCLSWLLKSFAVTLLEATGTLECSVSLHGKVLKPWCHEPCWLSHYQELLLYVTISSRVPYKEALPRDPPHWASSERERERRSIPRVPFIHLSKLLVDEPPSRFPNRAPIKRDAHLKSLTCLSSRVPSKGTLPPGSPSQSSHRERERRHTSRTPFNHLSKSLVDDPIPACPTEPPWRQMPVSRAFLS